MGVGGFGVFWIDSLRRLWGVRGLKQVGQKLWLKAHGAEEGAGAIENPSAGLDHRTDLSLVR